MERISVFTISKEYLRRRGRDLAFFAGAFCLFLLILFLYRVPLEPVLYAGLLVGVLGLVYAGLDFRRFLRRHRALEQLRQSAGTLLEELPPPWDLLERDYQELVAELFQDRERIRQEARQAQQELEEYYTLWVHQVKTPIAAARLLLQTGAGGEEASQLELELFKIERYVEMVLQYLRVESPSADLVIRPSSLDAIIRQAVRRYAPLFIQKRIALDYDGVDLEVLTDGKWLGFVLEQLLANALKYTQKGRIAIYLEEGEPPTLVVADTGMGIPPEDLPRIFEKGYTGLTGRTQRHSTGIGLYLCKRILDKLSHPVTVESQVGEGTRVKIGLTLPQRFLD